MDILLLGGMFLAGGIAGAFAMALVIAAKDN